MRVYGVSGALVATLAQGARAAGPHTITWDGRDVRGSLVAPGLYFVDVATGERHASARLVRAR